jgi:hypothetical protein
MMTFLRGFLLLGAAFLLLSMGGAIVVAPATVPLLYFAARSSGSAGYRHAAAVVAALTAAELTWAATYVAAGEPKPAIWLVPLMAAVVTFGLVARAPKRQVEIVS